MRRPLTSWPGRGCSLILCLIALLAVMPSAALADADPPSDVLLLQDAYYPYRPKVSRRLHGQLDDLTARAKHAGFPIKVAIVATPSDLGAIPQLFGHPERYARFLNREIRNNGPQPLLTVMPAGYGGADVGPKGTAMIRSLPRSVGSDGMARDAIVAVERLARANGHPIDTARLGVKSRRSSSGAPIALIAAPLVLVALVAAALTIRNRPRRLPPAPAPYDRDRDSR